jgi:hypothetical protein
MLNIINGTTISRVIFVKSLVHKWIKGNKLFL